MTAAALQIATLERFAEGHHVAAQALCEGGALLAVERLHRRSRPLDGPPGPPVACREGCASCCTLLVATTVPEVLLLAANARARGHRAALLDAVRAVLARVRGLDPDAYRAAATPCAFLRDRLCTAYDARPLSCRAHNSVDALDCQGGAEAVITSNMRERMGPGMLAAGLMSEVEVRGLLPLQVELHAGLEIALENWDAEARWLAGDPLFMPAEHAMPPGSTLADARRAIGAMTTIVPRIHG